MNQHASRVSPLGGIGVIATLLLSIALSGCYTRQIEGIQRDLDVIDRKIHKAGSGSGGSSSAAISPTEINQLKKELEMVRNQQLGLTSDLETLKTGGLEGSAFGPSSFASEPFPMPIDASSGKEIETLRKQIADNQKQIDRFDRELKSMQTTFDEVRASMLEVIELMKEEYIEEGYTPTPASGPTESAVPSGPSVSSAGPSGSVGTLASSAGARTYEVQAGDTLGSIASRHGVTVEELKRNNQIGNPNQLLRGQKIYIP